MEFLKNFNTTLLSAHPGVITVAEESTAWPPSHPPPYLGGLGFCFKWNMGWMHDTLTYFSRDPLYRKYHQNDLTFATLYQYTENFILPFSHDEVVHGKGSLAGKMPGDDWQKFANLARHARLSMAFPRQETAHDGERNWANSRNGTPMPVLTGRCSSKAPIIAACSNWCATSTNSTFAIPPSSTPITIPPDFSGLIAPTPNTASFPSSARRRMAAGAWP